MGFTIYFAVTEKGEGSLADFSDSISFNYSAAHEFFQNNTDAHLRIWSVIRNGDVDGGNPVIVPLTVDLISMINSLPDDSCQTRCLKRALKAGLAKKEPGHLFVSCQ
jgi:hypothetical protein